MAKKRVVMDAERIDRCITRIAYEILEKNKGVDELALIGIRTRGGISRPENSGENIPHRRIQCPIGNSRHHALSGRYW